MSAEGKAKRGASGQANAQANPFRINGWLPDWAARKIGATYAKSADSGGSTFMRGLLGGVIVENLGRGKMAGSYERMIEHAQTRVTHPLLRLDNDAG